MLHCEILLRLSAGDSRQASRIKALRNVSATELLQSKIKKQMRQAKSPHLLEFQMSCNGRGGGIRTPRPSAPKAGHGIRRKSLNGLGGGRALARALQHHPAALFAGLQTTGTGDLASGDRHPIRWLSEPRDGCATLMQSGTKFRQASYPCNGTPDAWLSLAYTRRSVCEVFGRRPL